MSAREQLTLGEVTLDATRRYQPAPTTMTTTATIAVSDLLKGLILANQGAGGGATYTMPTGTVLDAALHEFPVNYSFEFTITNISTNTLEIVTVAGATGMTAVGNMVIAPNVAAPATPPVATFRVRKTGKNAFSFYRVG